jgi:hypothetical protein
MGYMNPNRSILVGIQIAHLTVTNISNAAHLPTRSNYDAAWIAFYEQCSKPSRGCLVFRAGDPITIAGLKRCHCRRMRHIVICGTYPKDNSDKDTSDTTSIP